MNEWTDRLTGKERWTSQTEKDDRQSGGQKQRGDRTDRHRKTDRQTDRLANKHTDRNRQTDRTEEDKTGWWTHINSEKRGKTETEEQTQTDTLTQMCSQTEENGHTDGRLNGPTD